MYEIGMREIKGRDLIITVYIKGMLFFDAYKGVNRLDAEHKKIIKAIQPNVDLAKPEDIQ